MDEDYLFLLSVLSLSSSPALARPFLVTRVREKGASEKKTEEKAKRMVHEIRSEDAQNKATGRRGRKPK